MKRLFAFTLAETLIVMGIMGVVAALTLPNLNSSTGDKEKVAKLQKIYSNLQDALGRAEAVYGPFEEWCPTQDNWNITTQDNCNKRRFERIIEFMKYSKICTISDNCRLTFGDKSIETAGELSDYGIILADGSSLGIDCRIARTSCMFRIDINGPNKGANSACNDAFVFRISRQTDFELIPRTEKNPFRYSIANGLGWNVCTPWIIYNNNMDYLKVGSNGKCPDGKTILDWTTNTSCK